MAKRGEPFGGVGKPQPKGQVNNPVNYTTKRGNDFTPKVVAVRIAKGK